MLEGYRVRSGRLWHKQATEANCTLWGKGDIDRWLSNRGLLMRSMVTGVAIRTEIRLSLTSLSRSIPWCMLCMLDVLPVLASSLLCFLSFLCFRCFFFQSLYTSPFILFSICYPYLMSFTHTESQDYLCVCVCVCVFRRVTCMKMNKT